MVYVLLTAGVLCLLTSFEFIGPPGWLLGGLGVTLLISSYLWELYRRP